MVLFILRGLFILMAVLVAALYGLSIIQGAGSDSYALVKLVIAITAAAGIAALIIAIDVAQPRKKLSHISGVFLGLIVGLMASYALSFLIAFTGVLFPQIDPILLKGLNVFIGVVCVYVAVTLVLQTKDDFRFIIPYVEFAKKIRGTRPMILDTSAIIDGRVLDVASTHVLQGLVVVPRFVLNELQLIADSSDKLKRARGRRGLDIVAKLQHNPNVDVSIEDAEAEGATVDQKLVALAQEMQGRLVTTDFNLAKVAQVRGVEVINLNSLAEAMRPVVLPGELLSVKIVKPGEGANQGVGYLEDGTMVVVEHARDRLGQDVALAVTSSLQTSAGRMIFGRLHGEGAPSAAPAPAAQPSRST